jgi:KipI family sensor histidine kinase inhibitor
MMNFPTIQPVGDSALLILFGEQIDLPTNRRVHALAQILAEKAEAGLGECIPSYCGVLLNYDPLLLDYPSAEGFTWEAIALIPADEAWQPRIVEIPMMYGGECGPDLGFVAQHAGLSKAEVIRLHSEAAYPVYMMGFTPGFPYLGGLDARLASPRLDSPRSRVPAGSVGIAGEQTGIYPLESPGGWRIIGRTALRLFDPLADPPCLLAPGDEVHFIAVESF